MCNCVAIEVLLFNSFSVTEKGLLKSGKWPRNKFVQRCVNKSNVSDLDLLHEKLRFRLAELCDTKEWYK